ncbi:class I lanthipeptide [Flavobacteriaceae bacterium M23B6Z8]
MKKKTITKLSLNKERIAACDARNLPGGNGEFEGSYVSTCVISYWCDPEKVNINEGPEEAVGNMCYGGWW